ncbi:hypothetical protein FJ364_03050 [Candidatus Dependentiae bacterium]|nr:hypothetical protein [Candidatus Dependentiae bacterium]
MALNLNFSIPTHIIVGDQQQTSQAMIATLRALWCKSQVNDCFCTTCKQLMHQQHRFIAWIKPTKDYAVDDLAIIFEITSLALDEGQLFFFILEHSEKLTQATANRLLKSLEEPPPGYHFILLTSNLNALLPTIISRSEVINLGPSQAPDLHPLVAWFIKDQPLEAVQEFEQLLYRNKLSDSESIQLLDELFEQLEFKLAQAIKEGNDQQIQLTAQATFVHNAMHKLPQSGSSDLFWKQLWVHYPR